MLSWNQPMYQLQNKKTTRKTFFNGLLKEIMFISRLNYRPTKKFFWWDVYPVFAFMQYIKKYITNE